MAASAPVSSFSLFTKSKDLVLANKNTFGLLLLVPFLTGLFTTIRADDMSSAERFYSSSPGAGLDPTVLGVGAGLAIVFLVVSVVVNLMLYVLCIQTAHGKKPTLSEIWPTFKKYGGRLFLLSLLTALIIGVGLILLIVPGLIFLRRYYLAPYVMLDQDLSIGDSLTESARISKPFSGSVWGLIGVTILLSLPGIIPVIGWAISFALTSLYVVAPALRYLELKQLNAHHTTAPAE